MYVLNLNDTASDRWGVPLTGQIIKHGWNYTFQPVMDYVDHIVPDSFWWENEEELLRVGVPIVGDEIADECKGMQMLAAEIGHNVSAAKILFFQIFYEIVMECTGILAADSDGTMWHGRNMVRM